VSAAATRPASDARDVGRTDAAGRAPAEPAAVAARDGSASIDALRSKRRETRLARVTRTIRFLEIFGLGWVGPILRIAIGESLRPELRALGSGLFVPLAGIAFFLVFWSQTAPRVETSLGALPGRRYGRRRSTSRTITPPSARRRLPSMPARRNATRRSSPRAARIG
jgi:hypothetical protein